MNRRTFLFGACGCLLAPALAGAQQPAKIWRLGLFHVGLDHVPPSLEGLRQELRTLEYEEGRNIRLDFRNLADEAAARVTAREFVRSRVDLIVAFESQTVRAAQAATRDIPILFLHVTDPIAEKFVKDLAHPEANLTGVGELFRDLTPKRIEIMAAIEPRPKRLLLLTALKNPASQREVREARAAARAVGIELVERDVIDLKTVEGAFSGLKGGEVQGVLIQSSNVSTKFSSPILGWAKDHRLPVAFQRKEFVEQGALFSYGPDSRDVGREAAHYVDRILKGATPGSLPVQQVTRLYLVFNLNTAQALGLTIPQSLLLRADEVIR